MADTTFDEKLSIAVERYPVIYDKKNKDFKDKLIVENAWKEVISEVGLESVERGDFLMRMSFSSKQVKLSGGT